MPEITEAEFKQSLKQQDNVGAILRLFINYYKLDEWKPGAITKSAIINGLFSAIKTMKK